VGGPRLSSSAGHPPVSNSVASRISCRSCVRAPCCRRIAARDTIKQRIALSAISRERNRSAGSSTQVFHPSLSTGPFLLLLLLLPLPLPLPLPLRRAIWCDQGGGGRKSWISRRDIPGARNVSRYLALDDTNNPRVAEISDIGESTRGTADVFVLFRPGDPGYRRFGVYTVREPKSITCGGRYTTNVLADATRDTVWIVVRIYVYNLLKFLMRISISGMPGISRNVNLSL
jgi:hypothetical protein